MAVRDHASLVTHGNRNLVRTTVTNSSQRRTCATMLTLTSHYMATNAKHPRYAPGLSARSATQRNRQRGYWLREKVCRELGGCARFARGWRFGFARVGPGHSETGDPLRQNALDPGFHGVPPGPAPGARAAGSRGASVGRGAGGERGRDGGSAYGMMWEKGGVWGLGVI